MERPRRPRPSRAGFTLVELLIVILIIAALTALLLPTVFAAFRRAKESQVTAEMNNLATALASFKNTYGDYPPSRIILPEQGFKTVAPTGNAIAGASSSNSDMLDTALVQRSKLYLRRFWPRANFDDPSTNSTPQKFFDFDGDGNPGGTHMLNGSECLAFFLGGLPIHSIDPVSNLPIISGVSGFSKSPVNPFISINNTAAGGANRTVPNYEFVTGRLIDLDHDNIPSYIDPIDLTLKGRRSYAYFCSYGVNGYDPNDVNGNDHNQSLAIDYEYEDDPTNLASSDTILVERGFLVNFPVYLSGTQTSASYAFSPAPNPYTSGLAAPISGAVAWQNPNSFQILCSGADRQWGLGGIYILNSPSGTAMPQPPQGTSTGQDPGLMYAYDADPPPGPTTAVRRRENDNISNFTNGRLQ